MARNGSASIDEATERRLDALREEARTHGRVAAPGVRAAGSPLPPARLAGESGEQPGYYGLPMVKQPPWIWTVPLYFFVGGAAGAAAVLAAATRWTRGETPLARDARRLALAGAAISPVLLIADLGRPSRFLNMLRVIKPQSPMSMGAWTLAAFSGAIGAANLARGVEANGRSTILAGTARAAGHVAEGTGAALGGVLATYTGVLVGVSTIPVWARNVRLLPAHFGASGLASAAAMLELRHDEPALHTIGRGAAAAETVAGLLIEADRSGEQTPLKRHGSGRLTRLGGLLSGPASLALRLFAGRSRTGRQAAAVASLAGSLLTRFAWLEAGKVSASESTPVR